MKSIKCLIGAIALTGMFVTISCNNGDGKTDEPAPAADSNLNQTPVKPANLMLVTAKVADYGKWLPAYEGHDTARLSHGLHDFVVCRGTKDSNMVMVVMKMDDVEKAKAFAESADLKAAMQKSGVMGKPDIRYLDVQMMDTTPNTNSQRILISHTVKDYDAWKTSFDSHKQARLDGGLSDRVVGFEVGDNKRVVLSFIINDAAKAEAFMASKDLKDKMDSAGVVGPPTTLYYNIAKKY